MNREELLAEAKRRYPIGTVFNSAANTNAKGLTVNNEPVFNDRGNIGCKDKGDNGIVYANKVWAEIISLPSEYPIGTKVKVVLDTKNASQSNSSSLPYNGIYSIKLWASETFTIMEGEPKLYQSYNKEYQNCYPLGLDGKLVGYVYSEALEKCNDEQYIECINDGDSFSTHPNALQYGCSNYDKDVDCKEGRVYKVIKAVKINNNTDGYSLEYDGKHYLIDKRGTTSSTEAAYNNQFKQNTVMKTFPITRSQFQDIHNIACSGWKSKITTMVTKKLGVFSTSCELDYETVKSMFEAATKEQMPVLVKIFPDYSNDKSIDLHKLIIDVPIRKSEEFENKSFWLNSYYNWEIKKDKAGSLCLVPTLK